MGRRLPGGVLAFSIVLFLALCATADGRAAALEDTDIEFEWEVEGQAPPPLRQKQRTQLYRFVSEVFRSPLPGLRHARNAVERRDLVQRFGTPLRSAQTQFRTRYPEALPYVETTLQFDGITIVAHSPQNADGTPSGPLQIRRIDMTTPAIALKYGLGVGQPLASFVALFGERGDGQPTSQEATFLDAARYPCDPPDAGASYALEYELVLALDDKRQVRGITVRFLEH